MSELLKNGIPGLKRNQDALADKEATLKALRSDPYIHREMRQKDIPESVLQDHAYTFKRWLNEIQPCISCKSLEECGQKRSGYHLGLTYDGVLMETVEACRYQQEKEQAVSHQANYLVSDLSEAMYLVDFASIDESNEDAKYGHALAEIVQRFMEEKGVYLYGNMGVGKTYLAACAANGIAKEGKKAAFIHYPSFCDRMARMFINGEYRGELEKCKFADILVIDDIGAEAVTERNRMNLLEILDARMQNRRMTWFTGNGDFNMLQNHLKYSSAGTDTAAADRIIERIRVLAKPIEVPGRDRRESSR